jgi:excisionase family DNA binding protein
VLAYYLRNTRSGRNVSGMTSTAEAEPESAYMKVSEVAARLNLSPRHVYDLAKEGALRTAKFGAGRKGLRITRDSVDEFEAASLGRN